MREKGCGMSKEKKTINSSREDLERWATDGGEFERHMDTIITIDPEAVLQRLADRSGISIERIKAEIKKAQLLCLSESDSIEVHTTLKDVLLSEIFGDFIPHTNVCAFCKRLVEPLTLPEGWLLIRH